MEEFQRVALIAVADRALALDTGKGLGQMGYKVVLTAGGEPAAAALRDQGLDTHFRPLNPENREEVATLIEALIANPGRIDVLIADATTLAPNPSACHTLCPAVLPLMRSQGYGRIALLSDFEPECGGAAEAAGDNVKINAVCPVDEKAEIALWLATLPDDGPTGGVFRCTDEEEAKA
jgi:NAD(P)-dependent dehydrogenase (short-subunit alcohol dehydrogenase family)